MTLMATRDWSRFDRIDFRDAAARIEGVLVRTPLEPVDAGDARVELRAKRENLQETGSFKARGAWNQISHLTEEQRAGGVIACSSGNHGKALAWAAARAGVSATIVMPVDAYPNKIEACRSLGAEVVLVEARAGAEDACEPYLARGATLIHPYASERTIQGAGTVGLEIAEDWPEVDVVVVPVGGGGLISGTSLALRRERGAEIRIFGAEPRGAPSLTLGIQMGKPVTLDAITTRVQGLCPPYSGQINIDICKETLDGVELMDDEEILAAQARLVQDGSVVEPAGAAAAAVVFSGHLPGEWLEGRSPEHPLRVAVVISGGNPDPDQLAKIRA